MKKLTNKLLLLLCALVLVSCLEVKFTESQPTHIAALKEFPNDLNGQYINQDGDTLMLNGIHFALVNRESKCTRLYEHDSLSETMQLKKWNQYYFLNIYEDKLWTVAFIQLENESDLRVSLIDAESEDVLEELSHLIKIDTLLSDDGEIICYVIEPDTVVLQQMISNQIFSDDYLFQKIPLR